MADIDKIKEMLETLSEIDFIRGHSKYFEERVILDGEKRTQQETLLKYIQQCLEDKYEAGLEEGYKTGCYLNIRRT